MLGWDFDGIAEAIHASRMSVLSAEQHESSEPPPPLSFSRDGLFDQAFGWGIFEFLVELVLGFATRLEEVVVVAGRIGLPALFLSSLKKIWFQVIMICFCFVFNRKMFVTYTLKKSR